MEKLIKDPETRTRGVISNQIQNNPTYKNVEKGEINRTLKEGGDIQRHINKKAKNKTAQDNPPNVFSQKGGYEYRNIKIKYRNMKQQKGSGIIT